MARMRHDFDLKKGWRGGNLGLKQRMWVALLLSVGFSALAGIGFMVAVFSCAKQKRLIKVNEPTALKSRYESSMDLDSYAKKLSTSKELSVEAQLSSGDIFENKGGLSGTNTMAINLRPVANRNNQFIVTVILKSGYRFDRPQDLRLPGVWSSSPQEYYKRSEVFWPEHLAKYESELSLANYVDRFNRLSLEEKIKPGYIFHKLGGLTLKSVKELSLVQLDENRFTIRVWLNKGYEFSKYNPNDYQHNNYWESQPMAYKQLSPEATNRAQTNGQPIAQNLEANEVALPVLLESYSAPMQIETYVDAFNKKSLKDKLGSIFSNPGGLNEQNLATISLTVANATKMNLLVLLKDGYLFPLSDGKHSRWEIGLDYQCTNADCQKTTDVSKRESSQAEVDPLAGKILVDLPQFLTEFSSHETKEEYIAKVNNTPLADRLTSARLLKSVGAGMNQTSVKNIWIENQAGDKLKVHVSLNEGYAFQSAPVNGKALSVASSEPITYQRIKKPQPSPVNKISQIALPESFSNYGSRMSLKEFISQHGKENLARQIRPNHLFKNLGGLSAQTVKRVDLLVVDDNHFRIQVWLNKGFVFKNELNVDRQPVDHWTSGLLSYKKYYVIPLPKFDARDGLNVSEAPAEYSERFNEHANLAFKYRLVSKFIDGLKETQLNQIELIPQDNYSAVVFKFTLKPEYSFDELGRQTWTTPKIAFQQLTLVQPPTAKSSVSGVFPSPAEWFNSLGTVDNQINQLFTLSGRIGLSSGVVGKIEYVPEYLAKKFRVRVHLKNNAVFKNSDMYTSTWTSDLIEYSQLKRVDFVTRSLVGAKDMGIDRFIETVKDDYDRDTRGGIIDLFINYHELFDKIQTLSLSKQDSKVVVEVKLKDGFVTAENSDIWRAELKYDRAQTGVINFEQNFWRFSVYAHDRAESRIEPISQGSLVKKVAGFFPPKTAIPPMVLENLRVWIEGTEGRAKLHWELTLKPGYVFSNGQRKISSLTRGYGPLDQGPYALVSPKLVNIDAEQSASAYVASWKHLKSRYRHEDYLREALTILTGLSETERPALKAKYFKDILVDNGYYPGEVIITFIAADGIYFVEENRYTTTPSEWIVKLNFRCP